MMKSFNDFRVGLFVGSTFIFTSLLRLYCRGGRNKYFPNLEDKNVLITGGNTGIGYETAKELAKLNACVIIACRSTERGERALDNLKKATKSDKIILKILDLADQKSIEDFSKEMEREKWHIDYLINNAGVFLTPELKTKDGFELQMGTNHLGHFRLTLELLNRKVLSENARIVNVSSKAHERANLDLNNLFLDGEYNRMRAYGNSKLANILFTQELQKKLDESGSNIKVFSLHPGVVRTELSRYILAGTIGMIIKFLILPFAYIILKSPNEGAQTSLHCALSPEAEKGKYYFDCKVKEPLLPENYVSIRERLWEMSEELTGVKLKYQK